MPKETVVFLRKKELIIRTISSILPRYLKLEDDLISIPDAKLSKDFKNVVIFFNTLKRKNEKEIEIENKLNFLSKDISALLLKGLELRNPIKIRFKKL